MAVPTVWGFQEIASLSCRMTPGNTADRLGRQEIAIRLSLSPSVYNFLVLGKCEVRTHALRRNGKFRQKC